jgi:hypothetical protein
MRIRTSMHVKKRGRLHKTSIKKYFFYVEAVAHLLNLIFNKVGYSVTPKIGS